MTKDTINYIKIILKANCDDRRDALLTAVEANNSDVSIRNAVTHYQAAHKALVDFVDYISDDDD